MKIAVLIPAYNSEDTIGPLLHSITPILPDATLFVVDDGCTDATAEISRAAGAEVLVHAQNRGKGAALKTGFEVILAREFDWIFTVDADGQHDPASLPLFVTAARNGADMIIGNRLHNRTGMPWPRLFSNTVTSWLLSRRTGVRIKDSQCGYRLIRSDLLRAFPLVTDNFELESEIIIKAALARYQICFVPIETIYHPHGPSKISHALDTWRFIKLFFRSLIWTSKDFIKESQTNG